MRQARPHRFCSDQIAAKLPTGGEPRGPENTGIGDSNVCCSKHCDLQITAYFRAHAGPEAFDVMGDENLR